MCFWCAKYWKVSGKFVLPGIPRPELPEIPRNSPELPGIPRNSKIPWNSPEIHGILRNSPEFPGIPRIPRNSTELSKKGSLCNLEFPRHTYVLTCLPISLSTNCLVHASAPQLAPLGKGAASSDAEWCGRGLAPKVARLSLWWSSQGSPSLRGQFGGLLVRLHVGFLLVPFISAYPDGCGGVWSCRFFC